MAINKIKPNILVISIVTVVGMKLVVLVVEVLKSFVAVVLVVVD